MMPAVVAAMALGELLGPAAGAHAATVITDLVSDSRELSPGAAFVALPGARSHGLDFAPAALAAGAAIVLYEASGSGPASRPQGLESAAPVLEVPGLKARLGELGALFYGRDQPPRGLVGITGTNGKTTVAWLLAQAFSQLGESCGYIGTLGYGRPGALDTHSLTTPDCLSLHRELASLGTSRAAVELSSHALDQNRVAGLGFPIAAFTNLSRDHLDWHRTMDAYFEAKAQLFMRPGLESAVINLGDAYGPLLAGRIAAPARAVTVAITPAERAAIEARPTGQGLAGQTLALSGQFGSARIESPLIGAINAENLIVAAGVLIAAGHSIEDAAGALSVATAPPGRLEVFGGPPERPWVVVDYAHTPAALERVLAELSLIATGELHCVFGCGGERDRGKRAPMGEVAARYAAHVVLTDDNPRGEEPIAIVADIKAGIVRHPDLRVIHARDEAIRTAISAADPGDVVLIAGKGHETSQTGAGEVRHFDDRAIVRGLLEGVS